MFTSDIKSTLQKVSYPGWNNNGIEVSVLRDDLIHPFISGNKWRKLKYNLVDFKNSKKNTLLTFGGAFSNHLVATAAIAKENGINTIGIVRGEENENPYLKFMRKNGMKLHFISRADYRNKKSEEFLSVLKEILRDKKWIEDDDIFVLPEGGSNHAAVRGASEINDDIQTESDYIVLACGTGATLAGISKRLLPHQHAIGISVLKATGYFEKEITRLDGDLKKTTINYNYHFGGYAKKEESLMEFCNNFYSETKIPVEPVYTGKMFFAVNDLIKKNYFKSGTKVTLIHTGGIFNFN